MSTALDLPELRMHLIPFLTRHDLTICARVSRDWNRTFEHVMSFVPSQLRAGTNLPPETLFRHSGSILKLRSTWPKTLWGQELNCPNLSDPVIVGNMHQPGIDFIERHRASLEKVFLGIGLRIDNHELRDADDLWRALASCPSLQSLYVGDCHLLANLVASENSKTYKKYESLLVSCQTTPTATKSATVPLWFFRSSVRPRSRNWTWNWLIVT